MLLKDFASTALIEKSPLLEFAENGDRVAAAEGATLFKLVDQIGMGRPGAVEHTFGPIGGAGANDLLGLIGFDPVVQLGDTGGGPTGSAECHAFREAGGIVRWHIEQREELA